MDESKYLIVSLTVKEQKRIFQRISIDYNTGCWNWNGQLTKDGYGQVWYNKKNTLVHRLIYSWLIEPIPVGRSPEIPNLDHIICNNKKCCNPSHIKLVIPKLNILRSNSPVAINSRKTHCIHGHILPVGSRDLGGGRMGRDCKICRSINAKAKRNGPRREELLAKRREHRKINKRAEVTH